MSEEIAATVIRQWQSIPLVVVVTTSASHGACEKLRQHVLTLYVAYPVLAGVSFVSLRNWALYRHSTLNFSHLHQSIFCIRCSVVPACPPKPEALFAIIGAHRVSFDVWISQS